MTTEQFAVSADPRVDAALKALEPLVGQAWLFPPAITTAGTLTFPFARFDIDVDSVERRSILVGEPLGAVNVGDGDPEVDWVWTDPEAWTEDDDYPFDKAPWSDALMGRPGYEIDRLISATHDATGANAVAIGVDRAELLAAMLPAWMTPYYQELGFEIQSGATELPPVVLHEIAPGHVDPMGDAESTVFTTVGRLSADAAAAGLKAGIEGLYAKPDPSEQQTIGADLDQVVSDLTAPDWLLTSTGVGETGMIDMRVAIAGDDNRWTALSLAGDSVIVSPNASPHLVTAEILRALGREWPDAAPLSLSLTRGEAALMAAMADEYRARGEEGLTSTVAEALGALDGPAANSVAAAIQTVVTDIGEADLMDGATELIRFTDDRVSATGVIKLVAAALSGIRTYATVALARDGELVHRFLFVDTDHGMYVFTDTAPAMGDQPTRGIEMAAIGTAGVRELLLDLVGVDATV